MGFRFSIEHANWLAHVLQPSGATPKLEDESEQRGTLQKFIDTFAQNFYSSPRGRYNIEYFIHGPRLDTGRQPSVKTLSTLRDYFRDIPWVSLLLPSGNDPESDRLLTDSEFLSDLVRIRPEDPGLILQLDQVPQEEIALDHVFPAFKVALAEVTRWPGVLVWTPSGDSGFFELSRNPNSIRERLEWLYSHLATHYGPPNLQILKQQFSREVLGGKEDFPQVIIIHLSDLHLGSQLARRRLPRVQTLIQSVVNELGEQAPIVPVVTGDLMDSPSEVNLGDVRTFMGFLNSLGIEKPIVVLGNHDVREDGWLSPQLEQAVNISRAPVVWMDDHKVGFACFNSVNGGHLARGFIGETELTYVGNAMDEHAEKALAFTMVATLHHHPIPVEHPSWYRRKWYERLLGSMFEKTEDLEDAEIFLGWLGKRGIPAVLHGHKHIPRFDKHGDLAVIGCGSTVGKVETAESGHTYMSINVVTIDRARGLIGCRLRAERIPGAGLEAVESHELVMKSTLPKLGLTSASTRTHRKRRAPVKRAVGFEEGGNE
jgi:hypothetical protein